MFSKILIANRGEIACRVIDTCRKLGVMTVAIYSDADKNARHVEMADEAAHVGEAQVSESYLQMDRIVEAAKKTGAQAIHPGFGFLSENPEFVEKVEKEGLTFIGPSASSMRAMGLKDAAKALMEKADVPVVPGYHGDEQSADFLVKEADRIGYPVLIKARAGGGGKGMRKVDEPADFPAMLESAAREGQSSFGDGHVLIEKYINAPRHIEVQVFGDSLGTVLHLFERDCSLQRRHQKVIEEAPAPGMTDALRKAMTDAAVRAAKTIDYEGAGTIEFIVDGENLSPDGFWFMEMNTRLQVEHPVTEAITGVDLVEWQLRVASGEALPVGQNDLSINGHAFEARIYAEDPANDFLPATGALDVLRFPEKARIETGVREGDEITPFYDPMIAKVITSGPTRNEALTRMTEALDQTQTVGCITNINFLGRLCRDPKFASGMVDTGFIGRSMEELVQERKPHQAHLFGAALREFGAFSELTQPGTWQLWGNPSRLIDLEWEGNTYQIRVTLHEPSTYEIEMNGETTRVEITKGRKQDRYQLNINETPFFLDVVQKQEATIIFMDSDGYVFTPVNWELPGADSLANQGNLTVAPMPGAITACHVEVGDTITKGQALLVMEAMKMEHVLEAGMDGVVEELSATVGEQVEKGAVLVTLGEAS